MLLIPAIDLLDGRVVRLTEGNYDHVSHYDTDLLSMLAVYQNAGFRRVHVIDLDGAKGKPPTGEIEQAIRTFPNLQFQIGGGIRSVTRAEEMIHKGAAFVVVGSAAITNPLFLPELTVVETERVIIAIDVLDHKLRYNGWQSESPVPLENFISDAMSLGYKQFLCTDIRKDGMLAGPGLDLYAELQNEFSEIRLIASGGMRSLEDAEALHKLSIQAAVIGKAIYEGHINLDSMAQWNKERAQ